MDKDAEAFEPLSRAYGLPKSTPEEIAEKEEIMENALNVACGVPIEIMKTCARGIDLVEVFAAKGSRIALSDAGVGATLLKSAMQGASLNVYINTKSMKDRKRAEELKAKVEKLKAQDITPMLGIIRIGEREDDIAYEKGAAKRCETLGVTYEKFLLPADVKEEEVLKTISQVNKNDKIHGVLLFRPLPKHLNEDRIVNALAVEKDVDGITDLSMAGIRTMYAKCLHGGAGALRNRLHR